MRHLVKDIAAEGRTVFVSSHLMTEMQQTADHLVVMWRGRLIADASTNEVLAATGRQAVRVRTTDPAVLAMALERAGATVEELDDGALLVTGVTTEVVGASAREVDLALHELSEITSTLEQVYLELTADNLDFAALAEDSKDAP